MASTHVVSALSKKHSELQGELSILEKQMQRLKENLNAVETSIRLFEPDFNVTQIKPKKQHKKSENIERGAVPKLVGDFVRLSDKEFTVSDIISYVIDSLGVELDKHESDKVSAGVAKAIRRLADKRRIIQIGRGTGKGSPIIWVSND